MANFVSNFAIGDSVAVKKHNKSCDIPDIELGTVISVKFTKAKVFYDVLLDDNSRIKRDVDSALVEVPEQFAPKA